MRKLFLIAIIILMVVGCSTLKVGDVSYNSFMSTTDTLIITRPDGSKINLKGKTTLDPAMLSGLLTK